jgi:hypothetical protein
MMAPMSRPEGASVRVCLGLWALASLIWGLLASVPLHQPDHETLTIARSFGFHAPTSFPDGHRIIDSWWLPSITVCVAGFALLLWRRTWAAQTAIVGRSRAFIVRHRALLIVLLCAFVARLALAERGGQYFDWVGSVRWLTVLGTLMVGQLIWNAVPLYALRFPRDVTRWARSEFGDDIIIGVKSFVLDLGDNAGLSPTDHRRFVVVNDRDIWIESDRLPMPRPISGRVLYRTTHPRQLFIYQYHGYKEQLRSVLRRTDLATQVIDRGAIAKTDR